MSFVYPATGKICRDVDGREDGHDMIAKVWIIHADDPRYYGTGRADDRLFDVLALYVKPCVGRNHLGGAGNLENVVKAEIEKTAQDVAYVVKIVKLTVKRRRRKRYGVFVVVKNRQRIVVCFFCFVLAYLDALTAVDATRRIDDGVAVSYADRLCGTTLETGGTAFTFADIK